MVIRVRTLAAGLALSGALLQATSAEAIVVARITRRGYILTDGPDDEVVFGERLPAENQREIVRFIQEATYVLSQTEGFVEGRYLAAMQIPSTQDPLAYYLPIRNDTRGIGVRSSTDGRTEVFDTNRLFGTAFTLDAFLYLNSLRFYTDPRAVNFGRFLICTQEFGHRYGVNVSVPAYPGFPNGPPPPDAGPSAPADAATDAEVDPDATATGGGDPDASLPDTDAAVADVGTPTPDVAVGDAGPTGPQPLALDALLGRGNRTATGMVVNRSHWSFFFNSGGSPMEGNAWTELSPGMFRTERPSFRFSDFDLYLMGLIPASEVRPSYLIAEPQNVPRGYGRDSPPTYYNQQVTVRGRRVDVTVQDLIRVNGNRSPAFPNTQRELDVVWVLWAPPEAINDALVAEFDEAIDSCALGYDTSTGNRGRLRAAVSPNASPLTEDAGSPIVDAGTLADVPFIADVSMATPDTGPVTAPSEAGGGCGCRTLPTTGPGSRTGLALSALALGLALARRRRRPA